MFNSLLELKDKKILIAGFGIEGKSTYRFLRKNFPGKKLGIADRKLISEWSKEMYETVRDDTELSFHFGDDYLNSLCDYEIIFRTPGIRPDQKEIQKALQEGKVVTSQLKFFLSLFKGKTIGVTGTKGKGTTSTLIYETLKKGGKKVSLLGNIGKPFLEIENLDDSKMWAVLELSSFQLMDLEKSPHIAVVLNITTDHLDWHKDRNEYVNAKLPIVKYQKKKDFAVINHDYKDSYRFGESTRAKKYYFSVKDKVQGSYVDKNKIYLNFVEKKLVGDTNALLLRGKHNWENVTASICASYLAGVGREAIKKAVYNFKGLEHRLELVGKYEGVEFYNDSFSTNPQTSIAAINSFDEPVTLILGGFDKGLDYSDLAKKISEKENINAVVLIGDIASKIEKVLKHAHYSKKLVKLAKSDMKKIVKTCMEITPKSGVVVLSPGTSSFDMFESYKDRGERFKKNIYNLKKKSSD